MNTSTRDRTHEFVATSDLHDAELDTDGEEHAGPRSAETDAATSRLSTRARAEAAERGAGPGRATASELALAGPASDRKINVQKKKEWKTQEERREAAQKARTTARKGEAWTAAELSVLIEEQGAEAVLVSFNRREPKSGIQTLKDAGAWQTVLGALPRGALTASARHALNELVMDGVFELNDVKQLFAIRFAHDLEEVVFRGAAKGAWKLDVLQILWRQLHVLPDVDCTLNNAITTFEAIGGTESQSAYGPAWDNPEINTVKLGDELALDPRRMEHTVRHEIGHGVHAEIAAQVNPWLQNDMQFWFIDIDALVAELGGYPTKWTPASTGVETDISDQNRQAIKQLIENWMGHGSWSPTRASPETGKNADVHAVWAAVDAKIKNACAQSPEYWFQNHEQFQQVGGKRYFFNHYYHKAFTIGPAAHEAIKATGESYTAMSEKEFFANCYAEYFRDPEGVRDESKWGGQLPASVTAFFKSVVVHRNPYTRFKELEKQSKPQA